MNRHDRKLQRMAATVGGLRALRAAPLQRRRLLCRVRRAQLHDVGLVGAACRDCAWLAVGLSDLSPGARRDPGAGVQKFRAVGRRPGGMVVSRLREFGSADDGDRRRRHRRDRSAAAGHGRGPAERDLAGDRAAALGTARPGLLDLDNAWARLLVGLSLSLSTYFEIAARHVGFGQQAFQWIESGWLHGLARAVPAVLEFIALTLLYWLIPNCAVRWRDGALGALISDRGDRDPEGRVYDLYRRHVLLSDRLRHARGDPDLSVVDVYFMDGGAARRGDRRRLAALADRRGGSARFRRAACSSV